MQEWMRSSIYDRATFAALCKLQLKTYAYRPYSSNVLYDSHSCISFFYLHVSVDCDKNALWRYVRNKYVKSFSDNVNSRSKPKRKRSKMQQAVTEVVDVYDNRIDECINAVTLQQFVNMFCIKMYNYRWNF